MAPDGIKLWFLSIILIKLIFTIFRSEAEDVTGESQVSPGGCKIDPFLTTVHKDSVLHLQQQ
jgi:hypothetical protein